MTYKEASKAFGDEVPDLSLETLGLAKKAVEKQIPKKPYTGTTVRCVHLILPESMEAATTVSAADRRLFGAMTMAEYIEREALLEALKEFRLNETMSKHLTREDCETARNAVERAQMVIERIPAADVAPVRHGRWITWEEAGNDIPSPHRHECSVCHDAAQVLVNGVELLSDYCPNCGAKMDGAE